MSTHVLSHCKIPAANKKYLFEGMLWACDCGKVYRYTIDRMVTVNGKEASYYKWTEFEL